MRGLRPIVFRFCTTLMLTTAGPYFSTSPLKSGSAATGVAADDCVGVGTTAGGVAAVACSVTRSATTTPVANAAARASTIALRRKFMVCIVCSSNILVGALFAHEHER